MMMDLYPRRIEGDKIELVIVCIDNDLFYLVRINTSDTDYVEHEVTGCGGASISLLHNVLILCLRDNGEYYLVYKGYDIDHVMVLTLRIYILIQG